MARWKALVEFLLSVIELLFYLLPLTRYKAIRVKTLLFWRGCVSLSQYFRGKGSSLGNIFSFFKTRHILLFNGANCNVLRAVVLTQYRRVADRQTDRRTDRQTDGNAITSTARRNARIASAVLATAIPSVCLSVCLSVTRRYCVKTTARSTVQFTLLDIKMYLVL